MTLPLISYLLYITIKPYYHLIESKIYKPLPPKPKKKPHQNIGSVFFENKDMKFTNIAGILHDADIVKSLSLSIVKFSMVTYKLTPPASTTFFNFN